MAVRDRSGFVYVLKNSSVRGLIKVGWAKDPERRARTLSKPTGVPGKYRVKVAVAFADAITAERRVHKLLQRSHHGGEYFTCRVDEARVAIERVKREMEPPRPQNPKRQQSSSTPPAPPPVRPLLGQDNPRLEDSPSSPRYWRQREPDLIQRLTADDLERTLSTAPLALIVFHGHWNAEAQRIDRILVDELAGDSLPVFAVDTIGYPSVAEKYRVVLRQRPELVVFVKGEPVSRAVAIAEVSYIRRFLRQGSGGE